MAALMSNTDRRRKLDWKNECREAPGAFVSHVIFTFLATPLRVLGSGIMILLSSSHIQAAHNKFGFPHLLWHLAICLLFLALKPKGDARLSHHGINNHSSRNAAHNNALDVLHGIRHTLRPYLSPLAKILGSRLAAITGAYEM